MNLPEWMQPLPERSAWETFESGVTIDFYTAEQMRQAQLDAVEAYKASLKPWMREVEPGKFVAYYRLDGETK